MAWQDVTMSRESQPKVGLLSALHVGRPRALDPETPWTSAIYKTRVFDPVWLGTTNLVGDEQADRTVHGGPDKAVCAYSGDHYAAWRSETGVALCGPGWFGENFTLSGLTEVDIAIGDTFSVGDAVVQVSQPRSPCWKLARRWALPDMTKRVVVTNRTGWYFRVLREGTVRTGDFCERVERRHPQWTIARVNAVAYNRGVSPSELDGLRRELAGLLELSEAWRADLAE
jgi:MOSC domain-containing protein YiiM